MANDNVRTTATPAKTFVTAGALKKACHHRRLKRAFGQTVIRNWLDPGNR